MTCNEPILDLLPLDSHSKLIMVLADISQYPTNFNIVTPTIEITPPGYMMESIDFTPKTIEAFNSQMLGIACGSNDCCATPLPDGIYKIKYSVYPHYKYFVNKSIIRVEQLIEKFDKAYLKLDMYQCDTELKKQQKKTIDNIWADINGAIASANNCADKQAMDLYKKADKLIDGLLKNYC